MRDIVGVAAVLVVVVVAILTIVILLWAVRSNDADRRTECREFGGVAVPSSSGWTCHLPTPSPRGLGIGPSTAPERAP